MARPITWQDVAAPRGLAVAVEAFGRGGDRLAEAVGNMGQIAVDFRNAKIKEATDAAIADIALSNDPTAVASALPQDWTIDPLAVAAATNTRKGQLKTEEVQQATLEGTKVQTDLNRRTLEDRENEQLIASRLLPLYDDAIKGSKLEDLVDLKDPFYQTKAGLTLVEKYNEYFRQGEQQRNEREQLRLQGVQARAAQQQLNMVFARQAADDKYAAWRQTKEGAMADLAEQQRMARVIGAQTGAGEAYGTLLPEKWAGARGRASEAELDRPTSAGLTGRELLTEQASRVAVAEANEASKIAQWDPLLRLGQEYDTNPFKGVDDFTSVKKVRELADEFNGEGWFSARYEDSDIIERVDQIIDYAQRKKKPIDRDQAFMIVGKTLPAITFGTDATDRIITQAVQRDIDLFHDFNVKGRTEGVNVAINRQKAETDKVRRDAARAATLIEGSLVGGGDVPKSLVEQLRPKKTGSGASAGW